MANGDPYDWEADQEIFDAAECLAVDESAPEHLELWGDYDEESGRYVLLVVLRVRKDHKAMLLDGITCKPRGS